MRLWKFALILAFALPALAWADRDVTVIGDLSKAGRKLPPADPAHPQFYQPLIGGYKELGDKIPGIVPPSVHDVVHVVALELRKRGYYVINGAHPKPDLLIDITWGMLNPSDSDDTGNDNAKNQIERFNLVMGHTVSSVMAVESYNRQEFLEAIHDQRFFVILTAFDPAAYARSKAANKKLDLGPGGGISLWQTKMSLVLDGVAFNDVLGKMVQAGAPLFGGETVGHPKLVTIVPEGHVEVGTPVVKPDTLSAATAPSAAPPPAK